MRSISSEISIDAPAELVWRVLTDLGSYEKWGRFLLKAEGTVEEGRSCKMWAKPPGPFTHHFRAKTLRVVPGREWVWSARLGNVPGINEIEISFVLVPEGDRTRFMQKKYFSGPLLFAAWRLFAEKQITKATHVLNWDLKREAERLHRGEMDSPPGVAQASLGAPVLKERLWVGKDPFFLDAFSGSWALITGASSELGGQLARQFVARGVRVVLVSRDLSRLGWTRHELNPALVKLVREDLLHDGAVERLRQALLSEGIHIRILVNAARVDSWGYFEALPLERQLAALRVNTQVPVEMCLAFRTDLVQHLTALVINVSSTAVGWPWPYMSVYTSTKSFVQQFSESLYSEWVWQGILVVCLQEPPRTEALSAQKMLRRFGLLGGEGQTQLFVQRALQELNWDRPIVRPFPLPWLLLLAKRLFSVRFLSVKMAQWNRPPVGGLLGSKEAQQLYPKQQNCPICGHVASPPRQEHLGVCQGNTEKYREVTYALWKCPDCATIVAVNPVNFAEIYSDYALSKRRLDGFARTTYGHLLKRLERAGLQHQHRILDMGCGNGVLVSFLKERGYHNVTGYDPYVAEFATPPQKGGFDCVVANDVIEHVEDPREFIASCLGYLVPGGILYIGTCDSESVSMQKLEKEITRLHQPYHRLLFTQAVLKKLGLESGAKIRASYKRSYMDTLKPFANYRFLDEACKAFGRSMDDALEPWSQAIYMFTPRVWFFGFFGYFFPSAYEPAIILEKKS